MRSQIFRILCNVFLEGSSLSDIILGLLYTAGLWFLFKKCGQKRWKAFIPAYKSYAFSQCADREMEGRILFMLECCMLPLRVAMVILTSEKEGVFLTVVYLLFGIIYTVYFVRVFIGLLENLHATKWWLVVVLAVYPAAVFLVGILKRYQPERQISEIDEDEKNYFSNSVSVLENGLTVNLEARTARDFFKNKYLLRDIHMNIKPGSMVLLLGGSGAGKTTLLNAIIGYEKANAEIMLDGQNVYSNYKQMMYDIGFVPQQDLMRGSDTVLRTLTDAAALRLPQNFSREERRSRVDEVMKIFGLTPVQGKLVDKLSGGQRKRLSISIEFLSNPTLFILDEPDSGLDGVMARELMQQLRMIADQGKIIIVITHTPDRVIDLFDDVIVLAKDEHRTGRLAYYGSIENARTFFERDSMEQIVKTINREEEGGDGRADELITKFMEVQHV
ncbi:MAG: ABC transporter ATP-binding protein [Blautia sp.]|nr:ABC transporter ATP-binding protein [Blautia sp.]